MTLLRGAALAAAVCIASVFAGSGAARADDQPGVFDYYVLALSWSPTYCQQEGATRDEPQCERDRAYGFVVHGLWPQYENGWPERCAAPGRVPRRVISNALDIIPARRAVLHQWRKHGTCSGLDPAAFFDLTRQAYESVTIPEPLRRLRRTLVIDPQVIESAFMEVNGISDSMIATVCRRGRLREVRLCLTKDLEPRECGRRARRDCRDESVRLPPVR